MTPQDRHDLHTLRDNMESFSDKKVLRRAIKHIYALEAKLSAIRTLTRAITNEAKIASTPDNTDATNEEQD